MKKKILSFILCAIFGITFAGCDTSQVNVNVSNSEELSSNQFGKFVEIGNNLVYDSATRIVYIESSTYYSYYTYTPYYAPNGLPYRYNPETNTLEEIVNE